MPHAPWHNAVLQTYAESDLAAARAMTLCLPSHRGRAKNWDSLAALDCILANTRPDGNILDAGAELYSVILPWLFLYGYRKLHGINLAFQERTQRGPIVYEHGDITRTLYESGSFDAVTCLSVIEHGVDLTAYFREMSRILKPGGILLTSTDYWETPVDTRGQVVYGAPVHIFSEVEIRDALRIAERFGFETTGPVPFGCKEGRALGRPRLHVHSFYASKSLKRAPPRLTRARFRGVGHPSVVAADLEVASKRGVCEVVVEHAHRKAALVGLRGSNEGPIWTAPWSGLGNVRAVRERDDPAARTCRVPIVFVEAHAA